MWLRGLWYYRTVYTLPYHCAALQKERTTHSEHDCNFGDFSRLIDLQDERLLS